MKIGIDPGISGAVAFVSDDEIKLFDMPIMQMPWSKKESNMVDTARLNVMIEDEIDNIECINIEIVHAMPKQGVSSTWKFGGAFYSAVTVANVLSDKHDIQINMVLPTQWKKKFGLINMQKDASRLLCLQMYPDLLPQLKRKKDVDRADALLIASY